MTTTPTPTVADALTALLPHQNDRTRNALPRPDPALLDKEPGGGTHPLPQTPTHLLELRHFALELMPADASALPAYDAMSGATPDQMAELLVQATDQAAAAIAAHDPQDWVADPTATTYDGTWKELSTLARVARPLNDYPHHLGSIHAIRRIHGNPNT